MARDLGDPVYEDSRLVPEESDGTGVQGDAVTYDSQGRVTPAGSATDYIVGILGEDSPEENDMVRTVQGGIAESRAGGAITPGDVLVPDDADAGALVSNGTGATFEVDTSTGDVITVPVRPAVAVESAADGEQFQVRFH